MTFLLRRNALHSWLKLASLALAALLTGRTVAATPPAAAFTANQIQAVYLFNFAQFVEWPAQAFPDAEAPLTIGILGRDPFGPLLDNVVSGEKINGRAITVQRFAQLSDVNRCHILFISPSEEARLAQILPSLAGRHILTVSNIKNFARRGGIIELVDDADRIRFRIALQRAKEESLSISAKLLRPAEVISALPIPRPFPLARYRRSRHDGPYAILSFLRWARITFGHDQSFNPEPW